MRRIRSVAMAGLLPLLGLVPVVGVAQQVYQPAAQPEAPPPPAQPGMQAQPAPAASAYTPAQLDQMLAPVALYPDALLTQVLMAATFPVQIVEADRWLQNPANAAIRGDALVGVLTPLPWDPSVKSLVPFPQIVKQMNDNLDWTQSLGTAFVDQQGDVMARVQVLRAQAAAAGTLVSTPQLRVVHESAAWIIEPADPAVVYVPVYNPTLVYGRWAYADYPPLYFAPAPGFFVGDVGPGIGFSVGFGVVGPLWGWGHPSWGGGGVVINNSYYSRISYNHASFAGGAWRHEGPVGLVHGAGFHGPGGPGFHGGAGFHGPEHGGGFHGPEHGGGFHGPAGGAAFHPPGGGAHGPAGGAHGPAGGFHGGGAPHAGPAAHAPAGGHPGGGAPGHAGRSTARPDGRRRAAWPAGGGHGPSPAAHAAAPHAAPHAAPASHGSNKGHH